VASRYDFGGKPLTGADISHLVAAHKHGVGEIDPEKIELKKIEA
jgi:hypothetical protein